MLSEPTNRAAADRLVVAALGVERDDRAGRVQALPSDLESLAGALRLAGRALEASALQVVPMAEPTGPICSRYQHAAASWPTAPPPSHEAFAGTLARLHDAAGAARHAARRCDDARRAVEALLRTSQRAGLP